MMQNRLYYNNVLVQKIREFGMGGDSKAEITIVVPRKDLTEQIVDVEKEVVVDSVEDLPKEEIEQVATVASEHTPKTNIEKVTEIWGTNKDGELYLGQDTESEVFEELCFSHKLNPLQVKAALAGTIKTHKGYTFEIR